jgi:multiple sugar transport system substrate-binding protein
MARLNLGTPDAPATLLPPRQSLLDDPATFEANPVLEGFADSMACAVTSDVVQPRWPEVEQILNEQLARAIYGEIDAATAVQEAAMQGEEILQQ